MGNRYVVVRNPHNVSAFNVVDSFKNVKILPQSVTPFTGDLFAMILNNIDLYYTWLNEANIEGDVLAAAALIRSNIKMMLSDLEALNK